MIVISSTLKDESVTIYSSLETALLKSDENGYKDVFVIGGRQLIEEVCTLYMVSEIYISYIHSSSVNNKYELGRCLIHKKSLSTTYIEFEVTASLQDDNKTLKIFI